MKLYHKIISLSIFITAFFISFVVVSCNNNSNLNSNSIESKPLTEKQLQEKYPGYRGVSSDYKHAGSKAINRWEDWKFGLRIHWGLYCMVGGHESWVLTKAKTKEFKDFYGTLWQFFNPVKFNADNWMKLMKEAGIKYFTFTTKHHDGFCMWPAQTKEKTLQMVDGFGEYDTVMKHYSIMDTHYKHDIVGELVKAARKNGIGIGLYYSHIDWHDPAFGWDPRNVAYDPNYTKKTEPKRWQRFIDHEREQLKELMSNYGKIDLLSFDIGWPAAAQQDAYDVAKMVRKLQPNILMRKRGIGPYGDYSTPERSIPLNPYSNKLNMPWQVIYPDGQAFSYLPNDKYKPSSWILSSLIDIVAKGGNFQVGFGPMPDGTWAPQIVKRLKYVGRWLKVNGEAIYKTRPYLRYKEGRDTRFTRSKDWKYVYAISLKWPGKQYVLHLVHAIKGSNIKMLGYDKNLKWHQDKDKLVIDIPDELQNPKNRPCVQAYAFKIKSARAGFTAAPNFLPDSVEIKNKPIKLRIESKDSNAKIYYTLNGTEPTSKSNLYIGPLELSKPTIIYARAYAPNKFRSDVTRAEITSIKNGVHFKYYEGVWKKLPDFNRLHVIKSGKLRNFNIAYHRRANHWGYEFTSYLKILSPGKYTFATNSDDGSKLYIDGKQVVNNDGSHGLHKSEGAIKLTPGKHKIHVTYFQDYAGIELDVLYAAPGMDLHKIPATLLYLK